MKNINLTAMHHGGNLALFRLPPLDEAGVGLRLLVVVDAHEEEVVGMLGHFCGILLA